MDKPQLTVAKVKAIKAGDKRTETFEGNGFGVRVGTSGKKSWVLVTRTLDGRTRFYTLGKVYFPDDPSEDLGDALDEARARTIGLTLAQARRKAATYREAIERGEDPGAAAGAAHRQRRAAPTVEAMCKDYLDRYARKHKRSWKADEAYIDRHIVPALGSFKAEDVTRRQVIAFVDAIAEETPVQANRVLGLLRTIYNWSIGRDMLEASPCDRVKAPTPEESRNRVLDDDELRALWAALLNVRPAGEPFDAERYSPVSATTSRALRLQLLTAQRIGEVCGATWAEMDLGRAWWIIPGARTKNGKEHRVPLTDDALAVLVDAKADAGDSPFVFPSKLHPTDDRPPEPIARGAATYALRRVRERCGLEHFTPHDLRRTAASLMTSARVPRLWVSKVLNHSDKADVTAIYDRNQYDGEKREALETWARVLREIVTTKGGKP